MLEIHLIYIIYNAPYETETVSNLFSGIREENNSVRKFDSISGILRRVVGRFDIKYPCTTYETDCTRLRFFKQKTGMASFSGMTSTL